MEALLLDAGFQERLRDTRVEGLLLVTTALQPHLPAFAARARATLAPLVEPPGGLPPLADFSGAPAGKGRVQGGCVRSGASEGDARRSLCPARAAPRPHPLLPACSLLPG